MSGQTQGEPSDAEVDAAFDEIVARLRMTTAESVPDDPEPLASPPDEPRPQPPVPGGATGWRVVEFTSYPAASDAPSPGRADPGGADPARTDHSRTDHSRTDPGRTEPSRRDPGLSGPTLEGEVLDAGDEHPRPNRDDWDDDELDGPTQTWAEMPRDPLPPLRPTVASVSAFVLITAATVVTLLAVAGVILPWWASWGALVAVLAAAGLLLSRIPRDRDDPDDDGARV